MKQPVTHDVNNDFNTAIATIKKISLLVGELKTLISNNYKEIESSDIYNELLKNEKTLNSLCVSLEKNVNSITEHKIDDNVDTNQHSKYVILRNGIPISDEVYTNEKDAAIEYEMWQRIIKKWPDGSNVEIVKV